MTDVGFGDAALIVRVAYDPQDAFVVDVIRKLEGFLNWYHYVEPDREYPDEFQGFVLVPYELCAEQAPVGSLAVFSSGFLGWEIVNPRADELWGQQPDWTHNMFPIAVNESETAKAIAESLRDVLYQYAYWLLMDMDDEELPPWASDYDDDKSEQIEAWLDGIFDAVEEVEEIYGDKSPAFEFVTAVLIVVIIYLIARMLAVGG